MLVGENMKTFEIKDEFIVDGKPIKILSGAIHYFRIVPKHWEIGRASCRERVCQYV